MRFIDYWQPYLATRSFVVLDGALATELERRGADLSDPLWSAKLLLDNPALIRQVHLDYLRAGADVVTSASYQASFAEFARRGLSHAQAEQLMIGSVRLAQEAQALFLQERATRENDKVTGWQGDKVTHEGVTLSPGHPVTLSPPPLVAASIGCYGACLHDGSEYRGDYGLSLEELIDWHRPRFAVLAHSGADLLACETIPCQVEAQALLALLDEFAAVPAWLSFSCKDETHVCHGETLAECVALTRGRPNVVAVGINCTPPRLIEPLLRSVAGATDKPLLVYPNSGETWNAEQRCWQCFTLLPTNWAALARLWFQAGAQLIGGCCRTTPETIREIRASQRG